MEMKMGVGKPTVSVCITTYNQEKYLAEALDSVLSQKVDFEFEIIAQIIKHATTIKPV